jgi:hypothetical protein
MKILNTEAMSDAVKEVISHCGFGVLTNPNKFQAAVRDFMLSSSLNTEQQLLIFSIRIGVGEELLKAVNKQVSEKKRILKVVNALLTVEYGFQQNRSDSILEAFVMALNWNKVVIPKSVHAVSDPPKPSPFIMVDRQSERGQAVKGAVITFGSHNWRVLHAKGKTAFLLADEITDIGIPYNTEYGETSWEESWVREWLNSEFLKRFSKAEQGRIQKRTVRAEANPWYLTDAGVQTEDKVFLLSISEVIRNFGDSGQLKLIPENMRIDEISPDMLSNVIDDKYNNLRQAMYKGEKTWWWLRSPGESKSKAAYVNTDGLIFINGELVGDDGGGSSVEVRPGVRPAVWIQQ